MMFILTRLRHAARPAALSDLGDLSPAQLQKHSALGKDHGRNRLAAVSGSALTRRPFVVFAL